MPSFFGLADFDIESLADVTSTSVSRERELSDVGLVLFKVIFSGEFSNAKVDLVLLDFPDALNVAVASSVVDEAVFKVIFSLELSGVRRDWRDFLVTLNVTSP